jgi:hypothetical protein
MGNRKLKLISLVMFAAVGVSACQTTAMKNLETPDARAGIRIINKTCVTTTGGIDQTLRKHDIKDETTKIHYISRGEDNWWKFGVRTRGRGGWVQGNIYINSKNKKVGCGDPGFKKRGHIYSFIEVPTQDDLFVKELGGETSTTSAPKIPDHSKSSERAVCSWATKTPEISWDDSKVAKPYVKEARRRGLTLTNCAELLGIATTQTPTPPSPSSADDSNLEGKLQNLKSLLEKGLITKDEAAAKRKTILDEM